MPALRRITADDLAALARLAAPLQADPTSHVVFLGVEADAILAELADTTWHDVGVLIEDGDEPTGWLAGDIDRDLGRVWWFGPFVSASVVDRATAADELLRAAREQLPAAITQEEIAVDARATDLIAWATARGFTRTVGSDVFVLEGPIDGSPPTGVRELEPRDHAVVAALHDELFPGTHTTGRTLVARHDELHRRLVIEIDGDVVGYVAVELHPGDEGYIDFVGVAPHARRRGRGAALVRAGVAELHRIGAHRVGLTVREDAAGARELYASLGFTEERLARPYRRGFSID